MHMTGISFGNYQKVNVVKHEIVCISDSVGLGEARGQGEEN